LRLKKEGKKIKRKKKEETFFGVKTVFALFSPIATTEVDARLERIMALESNVATGWGIAIELEFEEFDVKFEFEERMGLLFPEVDVLFCDIKEGEDEGRLKSSINLLNRGGGGDSSFLLYFILFFEI